MRNLSAVPHKRDNYANSEGANPRNRIIRATAAWQCAWT